MQAGGKRGSGFESSQLSGAVNALCPAGWRSVSFSYLFNDLYYYRTNTVERLVVMSHPAFLVRSAKAKL